MQYFRKDKYQTKMLSRTFYEKWKEETQSKVTYKQWNQCWKAIREAFYEAVIKNTGGVDLPEYLGNISIKILDREFKCADDFLKTSTAVVTEGERDYVRKPFISTDNKLGKIVWQKHHHYKLATGPLMMNGTRLFKKAVSNSLTGNLHRYEKARKYGTKKSVCKEKPDKGLFDL